MKIKIVNTGISFDEIRLNPVLHLGRLLSEGSPTMRHLFSSSVDQVSLGSLDDGSSYCFYGCVARIYKQDTSLQAEILKEKERIKKDRHVSKREFRKVKVLYDPKEEYFILYWNRKNEN
jgi:hypothetical protein